jgi:hypothetical protein
MEVFDWKYYISKYPDLRNAGIVSQRRALSHWNTSGKYENRFPSRKYERMIENRENLNNNKKSQDLKSENRNYQNSEISDSYTDIKSFVDKQKMEFTHSESTSDIQNINTILLEENNEILNNILKKINNLSENIKSMSINDLSDKIESSDDDSQYINSDEFIISNSFNKKNLKYHNINKK